jgi:alanine racemase
LYNLDLDAFRNSLEFQISISKGKKRAVIFGTEGLSELQINYFTQLINEFKPDYIYILNENEDFLTELTDTVILIKGNISKKLIRIANQLKLKRHHTHLKINLKVLKKNITIYKKSLPSGIKFMAMLKASGYGSGLDKLSQFIDDYGIDYFGVAFVDEGIEIRKAGITKSILVMNTETENYEACIQNKLEPSIFDFNQLDDFISECIYQKVLNYPIHIKIDTGMNRLGFNINNLKKVLEIIQAQPEIKIKSIYSHLAEADNLRDKRFTEHQLKLFLKSVNIVKQYIDYHFEQHILNTSGIENYPTTAFSMVRLGIGMFGISSNPVFKRKLENVISWYSVISQIKNVPAGNSVGYGRSYICKSDTVVATIPVGYADGLKRELSNGIGFLFVNEIKCPIIGYVCMDMVMIDITKANSINNLKVGDEVEIIGPNFSIEKMAKLLKTIPYEIMTSISERVHKIYVE